MDLRNPEFDKLMAFTGIGFMTGLFTTYITRKWATLAVPLDSLVNPNVVKSIAEELYESTGDFVINAWNYVGGDIEYVYYGSNLQFVDHTVHCTRCLLPMQVDEIGQANCVGKSVLLASILRNYYGPQDVYVVIGEFLYNGAGGHAWVNLKKDGVWYVLESTIPPGTDPWKSASDLSEIYIPDAWFNDQGIICYDPEVCSMQFVVKAHPCYGLNVVWTQEENYGCNC